mmetsp:Transcript_61089/g.139713  ORF Transcript_61089/g.139713 Transcript_61089/m.139713 type:complete len:269 (-) Transcript_61089:89-895(-)
MHAPQREPDRLRRGAGRSGDGSAVHAVGRRGRQGHHLRLRHRPRDLLVPHGELLPQPRRGEDRVVVLPRGCDSGADCGGRRGGGVGVLRRRTPLRPGHASAQARGGRASSGPYGEGRASSQDRAGGSAWREEHAGPCGEADTGPCCAQAPGALPQREASRALAQADPPGALAQADSPGAAHGGRGGAGALRHEQERAAGGVGARGALQGARAAFEGEGGDGGACGAVGAGGGARGWPERLVRARQECGAARGPRGGRASERRGRAPRR